MNTLRQAVHEYLRMRRSLGFKLQDAGKGLLDFVTFMEQRRAPYITQALALAWAQQPTHVQPAHWAKRLSFVRGFARYRSASDPRTQIPSPGLLPFQPKRARPYLYSDEEVKSLLRAALDMPHRYASGALLPWIYYCLFGLLSVSGLRLGEARNLELQDVDLEAGVLTVRSTKFGKTRLVPLHASTCKVLADYIARRQRHWAGRIVSSYLFVSSGGNQLDGGQIHRKVCPSLKQKRVTVHRLRHTMAMDLLKAGVDRSVIALWLGHESVETTQIYLEATLAMKEQALAKTTPPQGKPGRYQPGDRLLSFLNNL